MNSLYQIYLEALNEKQRYASEKGQKYSTYDQAVQYLKQHHNDPYLFVSYQDILKLGVNPNAVVNGGTYDTPLGIYSYPVSSMNISDFEKSNVPVGSDREHMYVFTVKDNVKNKLIFIKKDKEIDFSKTKVSKEKINELFSLFKTKNDQSPNTFYELFHEWYSFVKKQVKIKENFYSTCLKFDIEGIIDEGSSSIHNHEPVQAVFFKSSSLKIIMISDNKKAIRKKSNELDLVILENVSHILPQDQRVIFLTILDELTEAKVKSTEDIYFVLKNDEHKLHNFMYLLKRIIIKSKQQYKRSEFKVSYIEIVEEILNQLRKLEFENKK